MNNQRKNSNILSGFIAAICIILYLFAITQAAIRIYLSMDNQEIASEQEFSRIAGIASSAGMQGFMDEQFIQTVNNALAESPSIEALIITGPEGEYGFEKQPGRAIAWVNNSPRFINRLTFSNQSHYKPLQIHDLRNANIKAVSEAFNYNEILKVLKETLLLILVGFTLSFFTMLLQMLLGKKDENRETVHAPSPEYHPVNAKPVKQEEKRETVIIQAAPALSEASPKGLYSPRSNIGWEEYTNDRLDSELHRCSSTENDLTLIIIEFTEINETMFRHAAEEAVNFFSSRDLLFEYGKKGISVILPGVDLNTAISKSEKFHQRIMGKSAGDNKSILNIGLSSRSGRLLNAKRLIFETAEALNKAKHDSTSSIIAFKSDPEKYRAFIRNQA
jgi:GGDEF domain-containing protein